MIMRVVLWLLAGLLGFTPSPDYSHLVRPLAFAMTLDPVANPVETSIHCTAWVYNNRWITAAHCVADMETGEIHRTNYQVDGNVLNVVKADVIHDIAALSGLAVPQHGLTLASNTYSEEDVLAHKAPTTFYGFAFGWNHMVTTTGHMTLAAYDLHQDGLRVWDIYQVPVAPGMSGGPILNDHHQVIGVIQLAFCKDRGFCSAAGGANLYDLRAFLSSL